MCQSLCGKVFKSYAFTRELGKNCAASARRRCGVACRTDQRARVENIQVAECCCRAEADLGGHDCIRSNALAEAKPAPELVMARPNIRCRQKLPVAGPSTPDQLLGLRKSSVPMNCGEGQLWPSIPRQASSVLGPRASHRRAPFDLVKAWSVRGHQSRFLPILDQLHRHA